MNPMTDARTITSKSCRTSFMADTPLDVPAQFNSVGRFFQEDKLRVVAVNDRAFGVGLFDIDCPASAKSLGRLPRPPIFDPALFMPTDQLLSPDPFLTSGSKNLILALINWLQLAVQLII